MTYTDDRIDELQDESAFNALTILNQLEALWQTIAQCQREITELKRENGELRKALSPVVALPETTIDDGLQAWQPGDLADYKCAGYREDAIIVKVHAKRMTILVRRDGVYSPITVNKSSVYNWSGKSISTELEAESTKIRRAFGIFEAKTS